MQRYLITGGAGFIGSHLAEALSARGDAVTVLDDLSTGRRKNLASIAGQPGVEIVEGTILDAGLVAELMTGATACFHLASAVGVRKVVEEPLASLRINGRGTEIVVSTAAEVGCRLLFASSSEVYGKVHSGGLSEDDDRLLGSSFTARWNYALAKSYGEALVHAYSTQGGLAATTMRFFNTVGRRQRGAYGMVLPRLVSQALSGSDLTVYGDGSQTRCFTHVDDVISALMLLLDSPGAIGRPFNIGRPQECSISELAERIISRTGSASRIRLVPYEQAFDSGFEELGRRVPDISALTRLTGWSPIRGLDDAIDDVIADLAGCGGGSAVQADSMLTEAGAERA